MQLRSWKFAVAVVACLSLALAVACGSSTSAPAAPTSPTPSGGGGTADITISIVGMNGSNSYSPSPMTVKVGQTVAWHNSDSIVHSATADGGAFNTGLLSPGSSSAPITMNTAGTFPYHCSIHPDMTGTITVTQ